MEGNEHPNKPSDEPPTPEVAQLLKIIEIQVAAERARRKGPPAALQGASFRYGSLIIIVVFTFGSLGLLEWFLSQLPKQARSIATPPPALKSGTAPQVSHWN